MDRVERLRKLTQQLTAVKHFMDALGDSCPLLDEKEFAGTTTPEGDACRIQARAQYLLDVLACEIPRVQSPECCEKADQDYCDAFDACPP